MTVFLFISVLVILVIIAYREQQRRQDRADAMFRFVMKSLEEKAKKDNNFNVSYFGDKKDDRG